jgi:DNA-binding PucR family transcriptional regulator
MAIAASNVRLPAGALHDTIGEVTCAIIPDPDAPGLHAQLDRALSAVGARAGLGTTVGWSAAAVSFARARAALALAPDGIDSSGRALATPLISARDHAGELLLAVDATLAAEFAAVALAPLQSLSAGSRERLTATLRAWLDEQGRLAPAAKRLGIHPQTARYRVSRLRELFGDALDDGEQRFWLALALRASR